MNFIIGTAGHIDHGKTRLIGALTGRSTDRLLEEQKRGISIDLGFTYFDLPSGLRAGIIDVPGHERFIKNMIAGATGIDLVLLLVAADEGPMPQTREHMNILRFLDVKDAIIVVSKWDKADELMGELVIEELRSLQAGDVPDFFKDAPIIPVDSISGFGIKDLITLLDEKASQMEERTANTHMRLPIDRAFSLKGLGTIITGTLMEGSIGVGDELMIYPKKILTKVRSVQVHDENKERAYKGQRTALHIAGVKTEEIDRGDVVATPNSLSVTALLDVKLSVLSDSPIEVKHFTRARLYLGAKEVICRIIPLGQKNIQPGESAFCQLRLEETLVAKKGDLFVIRQYSPLLTMGGGVVLDASPPLHKASDEQIVERLLVQEHGSPGELLGSFILGYGKRGAKITDIINYVNEEAADTAALLDELVEAATIVLVNGNYFHQEIINAMGNDLVNRVGDFHKSYPLRAGMAKEAFKQSVFENMSQGTVDLILGLIEKAGKVVLGQGNVVALPDFKVVYTDSMSMKRDQLLAEIYTQGFEPEALSTTLSKDSEGAEMMEQEIGKRLITLEAGTLIHKDRMAEAENILYAYFEQADTITLATFRDSLGTTRKYAMLILEYFDRNRITLRVGDERKLYRESKK